MNTTTLQVGGFHQKRAGYRKRHPIYRPLTFAAVSILLAAAMIPMLGVGLDAFPEEQPALRGYLDDPQLQALNEDTLETLLGLAEDLERSDPDQVLDLGMSAVNERRAIAEAQIGKEMLSLLEQQQRNLQAARDLTKIIDEEPPGDEDRFARTVQLAKTGTSWQSASLGYDMDSVQLPATTAHVHPSEAARAVVELFDVPLTPELDARLQKLDGHPSLLQEGITKVLDAYLQVHSATQFAFAGMDRDLFALSDLKEMPSEARYSEWSGGAELDHAVEAPDAYSPPLKEHIGSKPVLDFSQVFVARSQLLDAIQELREALAIHPPVESDVCDPLLVPPAIAIDPTHCDNHYTQNFAFQLDMGGSDRYENNAGGSNIFGVCGALLDPGTYASAAVIDLGVADDQYGKNTCGVTGGGTLGVGFLLDEGGNDTYTSTLGWAMNGGSAAGVGFLLDGDGDDQYVGLDMANGGSDGYSPILPATFVGAGAGFLLDDGGNHTYAARIRGTNGGGYNSGTGFLLDTGGNDTYTTWYMGTNGGGWSGKGFLLDAGGDDLYAGIGGGINGGGAAQGVGFLYDRGGNDSFNASAEWGTNGGGAFGVGLLLDANGHDEYTATWGGANGGGFQAGIGFLIDGAGDDRYSTTEKGTNGGAYGDGYAAIGLLLDRAGDDRYLATLDGTNGGAEAGVGLLADLAGTDHYLDSLVDCWDCTVVPKGTVGAQMDRALSLEPLLPRP